MTKYIFILLATAISLAGCKSRKTTGQTPNAGDVGNYTSAKEVKKALSAKASPPNWVRMVADVEVKQGSTNVQASADMRMRQDSIMWIELSDNVVGFKVARAFAMADTVAFYNRLNRTWFAGNYSQVEDKLNTSVPFPYIFKIFQAILLEPTGDIEMAETGILVRKELDNKAVFVGVLASQNLDCITQTYESATDMLRVTYSNFKDVGGYRFAQNIFVEVIGRQNLTAKFTINQIEVGGPFKTQFSISSGYERIK